MFTKQEMKWFDKTAEIAATSNFEKYRVGCIAVLKNRIIAASPNKLKTHPTQAEFDKFRNFNSTDYMKNMHSLHAEIACLKSIKRDIRYKDLELYIVRVCRSGRLGLARPCSACMPFIRELGIRKIYYSTSIGYAAEFIN